MISTARLIVRLQREVRAWRDAAHTAQRAELDALETVVALRQRVGWLEARPGVTSSNLKLAHDLERVEFELAEVRERHRVACGLLARYADTYGELPSEVEA